MSETMIASEATNGVLEGVSLPKRGAPKGMLPLTWTGRGVRVEYRDASGQGQTISGKPLDTLPVGLIVGANGCCTLLRWASLILAELVER